MERLIDAAGSAGFTGADARLMAAIRAMLAVAKSRSGGPDRVVN